MSSLLPFRWREKDEKGEVFGNRAKFMGDLRGHIGGVAGLDGSDFVGHAEMGAATDDVVDFVLVVETLSIDRADSQPVDARASAGTRRNSW